MKNKGFTLIELLAVIVILAIIALIAVPVVVNIINDSKKSSEKESIKLYGKAVEQAVARYQLLNNSIPRFEELNIEYKGTIVDCKIKSINGDGTVYLSQCKVGDSEAKYSYGVEEESVINTSGECKEVIIGQEHFCTLSETSSTKTLLAQKNITLTITPEQSDSNERVVFADRKTDEKGRKYMYWQTAVGTSLHYCTNDGIIEDCGEPYERNGKYYYTSITDEEIEITDPENIQTYNVYGYSTKYKPYGDSEYPYVYDSNSSLYVYIDAYVKKLKEINNKVQSGRIASYEEMNATRLGSYRLPNWIYDISSSKAFWIGSSCYIAHIFYVNSAGIQSDQTPYYNPKGIRPVITILK